MFHQGWRQPNFFRPWLRETKQGNKNFSGRIKQIKLIYNNGEITFLDVRIYVILGFGDNHLGLLEAMHAEGMLHNKSDDKNNHEEEQQDHYFVVGIRIDPWTEQGQFLV